MNLNPDFSTITTEQHKMIDTIFDSSKEADDPRMGRTVDMSVVDGVGAELRRSISSSENGLAVFTFLMQMLTWESTDLIMYGLPKSTMTAEEKEMRRLRADAAAVKARKQAEERERRAERTTRAGKADWVKKAGTARRAEWSTRAAKVRDERMDVAVVEEAPVVEDPAVVAHRAAQAMARKVADERMHRLGSFRAAANAQEAELAGVLKELNFVVFSFVCGDKVMVVHTMPPTSAVASKTTSWGFFRVAFNFKKESATGAEPALMAACAKLGVAVDASNIEKGTPFPARSPFGGRQTHHPFWITVPEEIAVNLKVNPKYIETEWVKMDCDVLKRKFRAIYLETGANARVLLQAAAKSMVTKKLTCPPGESVPDDHYELQEDEVTRTLMAPSPAPPAAPVPELHRGVAALAPAGRGAAAIAAMPPTGRMMPPSAERGTWRK